MMRSMYSAIGGLKNHQIALDVTANDIANVNTIGYKGARTTFMDQLSQLQRGGGEPTPNSGGGNAVQIGLGAQLGSIDNSMGTGAFQSTNNVLDLAVQGDGWFRLTSQGPADPTTVTGAPAAADSFTRAGNFTRNRDGFLVTQTGQYLMGQAGAGDATPTYIRIPNTASNVAIAQNGAVSYIPEGGGPRVVAGFLTLAKFANEAGLERAAQNEWRASLNSGPEQRGVPGGTYGDTMSGVTEMSNVDLSTEFTDMITAQRGFQANSRVISTSDEMLQDLVNLKR